MTRRNVTGSARTYLRASDQWEATRRGRSGVRPDDSTLRRTFPRLLRPADPTDPGDAANQGTRRVLDHEFRADPLLFTGAEGDNSYRLRTSAIRRQPYLLWLPVDEERCRQNGLKEVRPRKFICVRAHALLCPGAGIAP